MTLRDALCALLLGIAAMPALVTSELPPPVKEKLPGLAPLGGGTMTWLGFTVYDATLWSTARPFDPARPFALDIRYRREISGERLVQTTLDEMRRLGEQDGARLERWREALQRIFPDVADGVRLVGVYLPGAGVSFWRGTESLGSVQDEAFARAFFGIWLDPRTRRPELRSALLGQR